MWSHDFEFANIEFLYILGIIPLIVVWYIYRNKNAFADIRLSETSSFSQARKSWKIYGRHLPFVLRSLALIALIVALARPQSSTSSQDINVEGIDIALTLDVSSSMLAEDFKPNRLEAAKNVAMDFISERRNDRIGLVVFSGESFTQCPLTTDHSVIRNMFEDIKTGMIDDGTAIGDGLATAVNRLKGSEAMSKVIILLTDGENNAGSLDPVSAAEIAKLYGIRVYTIGVGTQGTAPYPAQDVWGRKRYQQVEVKIDETMLQNVAQMTEGKYFRATDNQKLKDIYQEIDQLEKSKIDVTTFSQKHEEFLPWALLALVLIALEFVLKNMVFKTVP
ncbi:MAG: VWA domain-containing protein [Bacteroidales bacterium]|nr:VWA domain-containing protein [Bacteroidales bacterium]